VDPCPVTSKKNCGVGRGRRLGWRRKVARPLQATVCWNWPFARSASCVGPGADGGHGVWSGNWICLKSRWFVTSSPRLAIMGNRDAGSSGSIPVRCDRHGRLDEPTPTADHRIPSRREPSFARAARRAASTIQRRPAPSIGLQGQGFRSEASQRNRHAGDAGDVVGLAPEADRPKV
jgi:hypothetical protein